MLNKASKINSGDYPVKKGDSWNIALSLATSLAEHGRLRSGPWPHPSCSASFINISMYSSELSCSMACMDDEQITEHIEYISLCLFS